MLYLKIYIKYKIVYINIVYRYSLLALCLTEKFHYRCYGIIWQIFIFGKTHFKNIIFKKYDISIEHFDDHYYINQIQQHVFFIFFNIPHKSDHVTNSFISYKLCIHKKRTLCKKNKQNSKTLFLVIIKKFQHHLKKTSNCLKKKELSYYFLFSFSK